MDTETRMAEEAKLVEEAIRLEYRSKLKFKRVGTIIVLGFTMLGFAAVVVGVMGGVFGPWTGEVGAAFVSGMFLIVFVYAVCQAINWRCPRCAGRFGAQRNPRFCSNCGVRLRE